MRFRICAALLLLRVTTAEAVHEDSPKECPSRTTLNGSALLQAQVVLSRSIPVDAGGPGTGSGRAPRGGSCTALKGHGTHFTVNVEVGTPLKGEAAQHFDVVVDTGSDALIVMSCLCVERGICEASNKCFTGTNRSSSFSLAAGTPDHLREVVITFGSGTIESVLATDVARVGGVEAMMKGSLLLMVNQQLDLKGPFEGILGLGLPKADDVDANTGAPAAADDAERFRPKGFLEAAGVGRFSMCLNAGSEGAAAAGVLRVDTPPQAMPLPSIGQVHWGLDLQGVSVGAEDARPVLCGASDSKGQGQETACGAIPDSGTTMLMVDEEHLEPLFEALCDAWPRCQAAARNASEAKARVFVDVLEDCETWIDGEGLEALPPILLHLAGGGGAAQTVRIPARSWVMRTRQQEVRYVVRHIMGIIPVRVPVATGRRHTVCFPAIGPHTYRTAKNGPIWILGLPLFYEYVVGYDIAASPKTIALDSAACGACEDVSLVSGAAAGMRRSESAGLPQWLDAPPRLPSASLRGPL